MTSVSTMVSETEESIVPDSTTTNLERTEEFCRGQDILFKQKDGKYYLGTVAELDTTRERCLVKFADGTDSWALFKQLERLSAPTPTPNNTHHQQNTNLTLRRLDDTNSTGMGGGESDDNMSLLSLRMCVVCKRSAPARVKEIAQCAACGRGYHASCHVPIIGANVMKEEKSYKWICRRCYNDDDSLYYAQKFKDITTKTRASHKSVDLADFEIPNDTLKTLLDLKLPYDLDSLTWDPSHRFNIEQRYCYCGGPGDWTRCMLQCGRCRQWFHGQCIVCLRRPLFAGDQFYVFVCALCHRKDRKYITDKRCKDNGQESRNDDEKNDVKIVDEYGEELEFIRRLEMKWVDLIHLMLFNLTTFNAKKYFDLDSVLIPYIRDNWHSLQLPIKIASCSAAERRNTILTCLATNRNRFKCGRELKRQTTIWGLRVRLPPPAALYSLPANVRITERILRQHWCENKWIQLLANPPIGSEYTMGGLLVTRATMHCEKVVGIMRGVAYHVKDSPDGEIDDILDVSSRHNQFGSPTRSISPSRKFLSGITSTACQTTSSAILRQRTNPVQYAPGSVKKSASTVVPGNKAPLRGRPPLDKKRGWEGGSKVAVIKEYKVDDGSRIKNWNNHGNKDTRTTEDDTGLFANKTVGINNNNETKKRLMMKRNETRKLLRRKCRLEQERCKTEKKKTKLGLDANKSLPTDSSYSCRNNLPPTPPTSVSDPPTPPAIHQQSDYTSDNATSSFNTSKQHENKLTRANLSDRDKLDRRRDTSLDNRVGFTTPCDTSGDETSSKSTLDLIIPPPKNFVGRNNPFSVLPKGNRGVGLECMDGKKKVLDQYSLRVVVGRGKVSLKQSGAVKTLKRQLSAKDIRIGPNGEVKRRRIHRSLPQPQSTHPHNSSTLTTSALATNTQSIHNGTNSLSNASSLTGDDSWAPSVGNCMEYVLNGRRLRVRQEKQANAAAQMIGGAEIGDGIAKERKPVMVVIGGVVLGGGDGGVTASAKGSPVKGGPEPDISMDDLKSSVSSYFGAATRIASGERYTIRARRIGPTGNVQYLIEWDGTSSNPQTDYNLLYSTPQHNSTNQHLMTSNSNQYYSRITPSSSAKSGNNNVIHNPYYNATTNTLGSVSVGKFGGINMSGTIKTGSVSTGKLSGSWKGGAGRLTVGCSKSGSSSVARVLTLDSLRTFKSDL